MVNYSDDRLDAVFAALADPTRRAILARLARGEASVGELAAPLPVSAPAVTKHLKVLERAKLLQRRQGPKDARVHRCSVDPRPLRSAAAWIERYRVFWERRFDNLERLLKEMEESDDE